MLGEKNAAPTTTMKTISGRCAVQLLSLLLAMSLRIKLAVVGGVYKSMNSNFFHFKAENLFCASFSTC
jgi:hypothetical protein